MGSCGALLLVVVVLALSAGSGAARSTQATVGVYPSGTTFARLDAGARPTPRPPCRSRCRSAEWTTRRSSSAARRTSRSRSPTIDAPLELNLFFAHYVSVDGKAVPDALMPWDGSQRSTEHTNQPIWLQVTVPYGTAPGTYSGSVLVVADGNAKSVPISGHGLAGDAAAAEPGLRQPPHGVQLLAAVVRATRCTTSTASRQSRRSRASSASSPPTGSRRTTGATATRTRRPATRATGGGGSTSRRRWSPPPDSQGSSRRCGSRSRTTAGARRRTSAGCRPSSRRAGARTSGRCAASGRTTAGSARTRTCTGWTSPGQPPSGPCQAGEGHPLVLRRAATSSSPASRPPRTASSGTAARTTSTSGSCSRAATTASTRTRRCRAAASRTRRRSCG